jgi:hypothetical protein
MSDPYEHAGSAQSLNRPRRKLQMRKLLVLLSALGLAGTLHAADSFTGTWKLDTARSKFECSPTPKQITMIERKEGSITDMTVTGTDGSGKPIAIHLTYPTNGGPVKFPGGKAPLPGATYGVKNVTANTGHVTAMRGGKEIWAEKITVSADGRTMQSVRKRLVPNGKPWCTDVAMFEKQ